MELSKEFFEKLKLIDANLDAVFDDHEDSIHVSAMRRGGLKVLENTFKRNYGEMYPELERRVIEELKEQDVWKKFGSGKAYDDAIQKKFDESQASKKRELDHLDKEWNKENKKYINEAIENAKRGIFTMPQEARR